MSDFNNIDWGETIKLALGRGFCASLVITLFVVGQPGSTVGCVFGFILLWTFGSALFVIAMNLTLRFMNWVISWFAPGYGVGWAFLIPYWLAVFAIAIGDPVLWLFMKVAPGVFNLADFRPFNFTPLIIVRAAPAAYQPGPALVLPRSWRTGRSFE